MVFWAWLRHNTVHNTATAGFAVKYEVAVEEKQARGNNAFAGPKDAVPKNANAFSPAWEKSALLTSVFSDTNKERQSDSSS